MKSPPPRPRQDPIGEIPLKVKCSLPTLVWLELLDNRRVLDVERAIVLAKDGDLLSLGDRGRHGVWDLVVLGREEQ
jgi:hypothetical protein